MNSNFCPLYKIKIQEGPYVVYDKDVPGAQGIFQAYNYDTNQKCCAKIIEIKDDKERQKQITNHEQISTIFHENIIRVYKVLQEKNQLYVIQELCEMDFQKCLDDKQFELSLIEILNFISQISDGYLALTKKKIIHRDLKPQNILVNLDLRQNKVIYKICDFGLLKIPNIDRIITHQQQGTLCYQAPEITDSNYSNEADAFSFGIVLLQIILKKDLGQAQKKEFVQFLEQNEFQQWFKDAQQYLKNKHNSKSIEEDILKKTDPFLVDILNKLLVYKPENRISWEKLNEKVNTKIKWLTSKPTICYNPGFNQNQLSHQSNLSQSSSVFTQKQIQQQQQRQTIPPFQFQKINNQLHQQGQFQNQFQPIQRQFNQTINPQPSPMSNRGQNVQANKALQQVPGVSTPSQNFNQKKDN